MTKILLILFTFLIIVSNSWASDHYVLYNNTNGMVCIGLRKVYLLNSEATIDKATTANNDNRACYGPIPMEWQIAKTGFDWDGDGHYDILWRNIYTGGWSLWFMNGPYLISYTEQLETMGPEWVIK